MILEFRHLDDVKGMQKLLITVQKFMYLNLHVICL